MMLSYATVSMLVALGALAVAFVLLCIAIVNAIRFSYGGWADSTFAAMVYAFLGFSMAAQVLIALDAHGAGLRDWQLVGLYFNAICIFFGAIPLGAFFTFELVVNVRRNPVPSRLVTAATPVFGIAWAGEIIILLLR